MSVFFLRYHKQHLYTEMEMSLQWMFKSWAQELQRHPIFHGMYPTKQHELSNYPIYSNMYSNLGLFKTWAYNIQQLLTIRSLGNTMINRIWHRLPDPSGPGGTDECCCPNLCIWCFILIPSALYFAFVAPSLVANGIYLLPGGEVDCWRIWLTIC